MKKTRLTLAAAAVASVLLVPASPAQACSPNGDIDPCLAVWYLCEATADIRGQKIPCEVW